MQMVCTAKNFHRMLLQYKYCDVSLFLHVKTVMCDTLASFLLARECAAGSGVQLYVETARAASKQ